MNDINMEHMIASTDKQINFYELFGLKSDCSDKEIKKRYNELVLIHHPDKGGKREMFDIIMIAYEILGNPTTRNEYNILINAMKKNITYDHYSLKTNFDKHKKLDDVKPATATELLAFKTKMVELNKKHNFDEKEQTAIPLETANEKLEKLMHMRHTHDTEDMPDKIFDGPINLKKFNEAFDVANGKPGTRDIMPFQTPSCYEVGMFSNLNTLYTNFDNMEQLFHESDNQNSSDPFDTLFKKAQVKITASDIEKMTGADYVDNHNIIESDYNDSIKTRLFERKQDTSNFDAMNLNDYSKNDFAGYGIYEQLGINGINTMALNDFDIDDITKEYEKLKFNVETVETIEDRYQKMMSERNHFK
jgi:curved DNA-binding protein CbpA